MRKLLSVLILLTLVLGFVAAEELEMIDVFVPEEPQPIPEQEFDFIDIIDQPVVVVDVDKELTDTLHESKLSQINCDKGSFTIYKEGVINKEVYISCEGKTDVELAQEREGLAEEKIREVETVKKLRQEKFNNIRLTEVQVIKK